MMRRFRSKTESRLCGVQHFVEREKHCLEEFPLFLTITKNTKTSLFCRNNNKQHACGRRKKTDKKTEGIELMR
jgi:hypothetical protein